MVIQLPQDQLVADGVRRVTPTFSLTSYPDHGLCLHGELDLAAAPGLATAMRETVPDDGDVLIADLADLSFCSCSGLGVMVEENSRRQAVGSALVLVAPNRQIRRVLSITGLDHTFAIRDAA